MTYPTSLNGLSIRSLFLATLAWRLRYATCSRHPSRAREPPYQFGRGGSRIPSHRSVTPGTSHLSRTWHSLFANSEWDAVGGSHPRHLEIYPGCRSSPSGLAQNPPGERVRRRRGGVGPLLGSGVRVAVNDLLGPARERSLPEGCSFPYAMAGAVPGGNQPSLPRHAGGVFLALGTVVIPRPLLSESSSFFRRLPVAFPALALTFTHSSCGYEQKPTGRRASIKGPGETPRSLFSYTGPMKLLLLLPLLASCGHSDDPALMDPWGPPDSEILVFEQIWIYPSE